MGEGKEAGERRGRKGKRKGREWDKGREEREREREGEREIGRGREGGRQKERGRERDWKGERKGGRDRVRERESKDNEGRHLYSEKNRRLCRLPWRLFDKDWLPPPPTPYTPPLRDTRLSTETSGSPRIRKSTPGSTARSPRASLSTSRGDHQCSSWRGRYANSPTSFILSLSPAASVGVHVVWAVPYPSHAAQHPPLTAPSLTAWRAASAQPELPLCSKFLKGGPVQWQMMLSGHGGGGISYQEIYLPLFNLRLVEQNCSLWEDSSQDANMDAVDEPWLLSMLLTIRVEQSESNPLPLYYSTSPKSSLL